MVRKSCRGGRRPRSSHQHRPRATSGNSTVLLARDPGTMSARVDLCSLRCSLYQPAFVPKTHFRSRVSTDSAISDRSVLALWYLKLLLIHLRPLRSNCFWILWFIDNPRLAQAHIGSDFAFVELREMNYVSPG